MKRLIIAATVLLSAGLVGAAEDSTVTFIEHAQVAKGGTLVTAQNLSITVANRTAPGMVEVVVPLSGPSAHTELPGSEEATRELGLALAGLPPGCQSFGQALLDQGAGEGISLVEDLLGAVGFVAAARADVRSA